MKTNTIIILNIILLKLIFSSLISAQCIYPETGNSCISSESGEYIFRIDLQGNEKENIDSVYWQVKGGIEIVSSTQETVTIKSKNTIENNQKYSKGRIYCYAYVTHNINNDCRVTRPTLLSSKDVYKSFNTDSISNKIWGLSTIFVGDTCQYSIKPLFADIDNIGTDNYYWGFSSSFSHDIIYTSADGSAIALKVNNTLGGNDTIKVTAGQCNTDNPNSQFTFVINTTPISQNTCSAEVIPYNVPVYGANVFYTLTDPSNVIVKIYDKNDNYIRTIFSSYMGQGRQSVYFQPTNLISGETYKCVIEIGQDICITDFAVE